tara:strand:+ start:509 stop:886 length:378 start_codon:yes stop_codon:yes gene_type:complete
MASCYVVVGRRTLRKESWGGCVPFFGTIFRSIEKAFRALKRRASLDFSNLSIFNLFNLFQPFPTAFSNLFNLVPIFFNQYNLSQPFQKVKWPQAQGRRNLFNLSNLFNGNRLFSLDITIRAYVVH